MKQPHTTTSYLQAKIYLRFKRIFFFFLFKRTCQINNQNETEKKIHFDFYIDDLNKIIISLFNDQCSSNVRKIQNENDNYIL